MTIQARLNLQRGISENRLYPATNYTSDGSLIDEYVLAKVRAKEQNQERLILNPAAYDAFINQAAADIIKQVEQAFKN